MSDKPHENLATSPNPKSSEAFHIRSISIQLLPSNTWSRKRYTVPQINTTHISVNSFCSAVNCCYWQCLLRASVCAGTQSCKKAESCLKVAKTEEMWEQKKEAHWWKQKTRYRGLSVLPSKHNLHLSKMEKVEEHQIFIRIWGVWGRGGMMVTSLKYNPKTTSINKIWES